MTTYYVRAGGQGEGGTLPSLAEHFDKSELVDLAFRLGVNEDELQGESAGARSRSFVRYMQRRERLDELVALARLLRPEGGF